MLKTCRCCRTYIGDSQTFCHKHWALLPSRAQKQILKLTAAVRNREEGARDAFEVCVKEATAAIEVKELHARKKAHQEAHPEGND